MHYYKKQIGLYLLLFISLAANDLVLSALEPYSNIIDYGAKAEGNTLDTEAIQRAIDDCHKNGSGTVEFPAGTYLTGTIYLSNRLSCYSIG